MDTFQTYHADLHDPGWRPRIAAQLRDRGLVTFSGITSHADLVAVAQRLMTIRPHRDAGPDGVTVITSTQAQGSGYAAFTDAELIPHTDGSSVPDPPGLLLLACQQPADEGGRTRVADGARIISTLAEQYPAALRVLAAPRAAFFGAAGGYLGAVSEPAGLGRTRIRLRLDELAWFSADATDAVPLLRTVIARHMQTFRLRAGEGMLLSNTRWLHGRDRYHGLRTMLRVLGDPLPGTGIMPGFLSPAPAPATGTAGRIMTADAPEWPGEKAAGGHAVMPADSGLDDAGSPTRRGPTVVESLHRLKRLREEHPDVEIVAHGYWQAVIPAASGETIITRWNLGELLDKLDDLFAAAAKTSQTTAGITS